MDAAPLFDAVFRCRPRGPLSSPSVEPGRPRGDRTRDHMPVVNASPHRNHCLSSICDSQRATKSVESPLSQSSKYHLDGNLRISRALSIGLICARYRILALCQSRSSWRPTETRDDTFMGPGKQRISERSLWWTVKRKDTTNNSLD
jgi:hypothetical protein